MRLGSSRKMGVEEALQKALKIKAETVGAYSFEDCLQLFDGMRFGIHPSFRSMVASAISFRITRGALCLPVFAITMGSLIFLASALIL